MKVHQPRKMLLRFAAGILVGTAAIAEEPRQENQLSEPGKLIALIHPLNGTKVKGTVMFDREGKGVKITAKIGGLYPGQKHGLQVHQFGDLGSGGAESVGGVLQPVVKSQENSSGADRQASDFGDMMADADGNATLTVTLEGFALGYSESGLLGRAIVIYVYDDEKAASGKTEDRIAAGVIGIANSETSASSGVK